MSASDCRVSAGTRAATAGYPTTRTSDGRSLEGRPRTSLRNAVGLGVYVSQTNPAKCTR